MKGKPYSAQFIRDGEPVTHLLFDSKSSKERYGQAASWEDKDGEEYFFQFRGFTGVGKWKPRLVVGSILNLLFFRR